MGHFLSSIKLDVSTWELILLLFLIGCGIVIGLILGKRKIFILILGCYISFALMSFIPLKKIFPNLFGKEENFMAFIVVFLLISGLVYFVICRWVALASRSEKSIFYSLILGILLVGIVASVTFSFFPKDLLSVSSPLIIKIFSTPTAKFLWFIMPLIFVGIFRGRKLKT